MSAQTNCLDRTADEGRLSAAIDRYLAELETGRQPDLPQFVAQFPEIAEELIQPLQALHFIHRVAPQLREDESPEKSAAGAIPSLATLGDFRIIREIGRGGMGVVYEADQLSLGRRVAIKVFPFAAMLGDRQLQRFHNEARAAANLHHANIVPVFSVGCERGVHYYAMQLIDGQSLEQVIADLRRTWQAGTEGDGATEYGCEWDSLAADRSLAHALSMGTFETAVDRPGTADTTTAGDTGDKARLSSDDSTDSPAYHRSVARLIIQAAEALDFAHQRGIVHRDVKPANLLLDMSGKLWVSDFGLARIDTDAGVTLTGDLVGTLRYMSPEQALAKRAVVDHRTDVYSLGITLYELLTLRPAYKATDRQELLKQIAFEDPRTPRQLNRHVPFDLDTIVCKAIEKNPIDRYPSAAEMADDLRRFLASEPIRAKRETVVGRVAKWTRRHQAVAWATAATLLITTLVLGISTAVVVKAYNSEYTERRAKEEEFRRAEQERAAAQAERERAEEAEQKAEAGKLQARQLLYASDMLRAVRAWREKDYVTVLDLLSQHVPATGEPDLRGFEWRFLDASCRPTPDAEFRHGAPIRHCAVTPDAQRLITAGDDGYLRVWELDTGQLVGAVRAHEKVARDVAISPEGTRMVSGGDDDQVVLWDLVSLSRVRVLGQHPTGVEAVSWSPDGKLIASGARYSDVRIWSPDSGLLFAIEDDGRHESLVFSADSKRLYLPQKYELAVWDLQERKKLRVLNPNEDYGPRAMCALEGGELLACSDVFDAEIMVVDANTAAPVALLAGDCAYSQGFAASPDGRYLASAGTDGIVRLFDTSEVNHADGSGKPTIPNKRGVAMAAVAHSGALTAVAFVDGKRLLTAGDDGVARLWDIDRLADWRQLGPAGVASRISLMADQRTILIGNYDAELPLVIPGETPPRHSDPSRPFRGMASADRRWFANALASGEVVISNLQSGCVHGRLPPADVTAESASAFARDLDFSPDGKELAIAQADRGIVIWNVESRRPLRRLDAAHSNWPVRFSHDGRRLAAGNDHGLVVWDWRAGRVVYQSGSDTPGRLAWNSDDRLLAAADEQDIQLWDTETWEVVARLVGHVDAVRCLKFSPDGRTLLSGDKAGRIRLWHVSTGRPMGVLYESPSPREFSQDFAMPPDGRFIALAIQGGDRGSVLVSSAFGEAGR